MNFSMTQNEVSAFVLPLLRQCLPEGYSVSSVALVQGGVVIGGSYAVPWLPILKPRWEIALGVRYEASRKSIAVDVSSVRVEQKVYRYALALAAVDLQKMIRDAIRERVAKVDGVTIEDSEIWVDLARFAKKFAPLEGVLSDMRLEITSTAVQLDTTLVPEVC